MGIKNVLFFIFILIVFIQLTITRVAAVKCLCSCCLSEHAAYNQLIDFTSWFRQVSFLHKDAAECLRCDHSHAPLLCQCPQHWLFTNIDLFKSFKCTHRYVVLLPLNNTKIKSKSTTLHFLLN